MALRATGMKAVDALKVIGVTDPKGAMHLLGIRWDDLMERGLRKPSDPLNIDLRCQDWITGLPEGKVLDPLTLIDLSGCVNFVSIPRRFVLDGQSQLRLEGTSWDQEIPRYRPDGNFRMVSPSWITYGDIEAPMTLEDDDWRLCL
ncbi:MAG: hypothetical protein JSR64_10615 [Nitrospira sp.]|nr:hypothetical protein [Nitrospira sp.]